MFVLFFSKKGRFTFVDRPLIGVPENFNFWGEREHGENSYERCPFIVLSRSSREELLPRVELGTSSLPRMRSTTELKQHKSGKRDSNPRPPAWKASALSTELLSHCPAWGLCGCGWIRTTEVERQQIYSLPHLATLEHTQFQRSWSL